VIADETDGVDAAVDAAQHAERSRRSAQQRALADEAVGDDVPEPGVAVDDDDRRVRGGGQYAPVLPLCGRAGVAAFVHRLYVTVHPS
jgi:hypothetical protein